MRRVISLKRLRAFWQKHADAQVSLRRWHKIALAADWQSLRDVRHDFPHADGALVASGRTVTIFNVCGNKYRLIADILYKVQVIYIYRVLTHSEYSDGRWKEQL
jgi:mRNA interferase HigB